MELFIVFLAGLAISIFSSIVSGSIAILSIASLLAFGLSPLMALGTFRLGSLGSGLGSLPQYYKAKKILWQHVLPLTVVGLVGTVIGVNLILSFDEIILEKFIGFVLLAFIPFTLLKPKLGIEHVVVTVRSKITGYVFYGIASIWGSSISVGAGFMMMYAQMQFLGATLLESKGTNRIPSLFKIVLALGLFGYAGYVDWQIGSAFALGMFFGGYIGTHYAIKLGDTWLRYILLGSIGLFALKLILGF